ncbi:hypothetical protein KCU95_g115, partial [Aureobasidium melanogenum]
MTCHQDRCQESPWPKALVRGYDSRQLMIWIIGLTYFLTGACGSVLDVYREAYGEDLECVQIAEQKIPHGRSDAASDWRKPWPARLKRCHSVYSCSQVSFPR